MSAASSTGGGRVLPLRVTYDPLRPVTLGGDLVVNKQSGGRWRFELELVVTEPDVDGACRARRPSAVFSRAAGARARSLADVIVVEAELHQTESVQFTLTNQAPSFAPFRAYFTRTYLVVDACRSYA